MYKIPAVSCPRIYFFLFLGNFARPCKATSSLHGYPCRATVVGVVRVRSPVRMFSVDRSVHGFIVAVVS